LLQGRVYYFLAFFDLFLDFLRGEGEVELREESLLVLLLSSDHDLERLLREELVLRRDDFLSVLDDLL
jgi:hypothetical protein